MAKNENIERLQLVVSEFCPDSTVIELADSVSVVYPNGLGVYSPDKSEENIQWMIDYLSGQDTGNRK